MSKFTETDFTRLLYSNGSEASSEKQKIFKRLKKILVNGKILLKMLEYEMQQKRKKAFGPFMA